MDLEQHPKTATNRNRSLKKTALELSQPLLFRTKEDSKLQFRVDQEVPHLSNREDTWPSSPSHIPKDNLRGKCKDLPRDISSGNKLLSALL